MWGAAAPPCVRMPPLREHPALRRHPVPMPKVQGSVIEGWAEGSRAMGVLLQ